MTDAVRVRRVRGADAPPTRDRDTGGSPGVSPGDSLVRAPVVPAPIVDVRRRVTRLLVLRTIVVTVVLGLSVWALVRGEAPARSAVWLQSMIIAATYLASIVFGVLL